MNLKSPVFLFITQLAGKYSLPTTLHEIHVMDYMWCEMCVDKENDGQVSASAYGS